MSDENIGKQFKGIAGNLLLSDASDSLEQMKNIVRPYSDKVFADNMMSDKDQLRHPAIYAHNELYFAGLSLASATNHHNYNDWVDAVPELMKSSARVINAATGLIGDAGKLPLDSDHQAEFKNHFDNFHSKLNDYVNLYGDLER
jgi:hypothetical protein